MPLIRTGAAAADQSAKGCTKRVLVQDVLQEREREKKA